MVGQTERLVERARHGPHFLAADSFGHIDHISPIVPTHPRVEHSDPNASRRKPPDRRNVENESDEGEQPGNPDQPGSVHIVDDYA